MFDMEKKKSSDYTVTAIFIFMYFMIKNYNNYAILKQRSEFDQQYLLWEDQTP